MFVCLLIDAYNNAVQSQNLGVLNPPPSLVTSQLCLVSFWRQTNIKMSWDLGVTYRCYLQPFSTFQGLLKPFKSWVHPSKCKWIHLMSTRMYWQKKKQRKSKQADLAWAIYVSSECEVLDDKPWDLIDSPETFDFNLVLSSSWTHWLRRALSHPLPAPSVCVFKGVV